MFVACVQARVFLLVVFLILCMVLYTGVCVCVDPCYVLRVGEARGVCGPLSPSNGENVFFFFDEGHPNDQIDILRSSF